MDHTTMGKIPVDYNNPEYCKEFEAASDDVKGILPSESKINKRIVGTYEKLKLVEHMLKYFSTREALGVPIQEDKYEVMHWKKVEKMHRDRVEKLVSMLGLRSSMMGMPSSLKCTTEAERLEFGKNGVKMIELMDEVFKDEKVEVLDEENKVVISRCPDKRCQDMSKK